MSWLAQFSVDYIPVCLALLLRLHFLIFIARDYVSIKFDGNFIYIEEKRALSFLLFYLFFSLVNFKTSKRQRKR